MYGKEYLDSVDAANARRAINAAISMALREIEDVATREQVRADFTPGLRESQQQATSYSRYLMEAQRPSLVSPFLPTPTGFLGSMFGWR
jgi:hypothetical protein